MLHVIATAQRRGAEMFAADLIRSLDGGSVDQRVAVLRGDGHARAVYAAPIVPLDRGARVPGVRMEMRTVVSLNEVVRGWRPDVIQAHGGEPFKYSLVAARRGGARVVYRRIGLVHPRAARGFTREIHGALMRRSDRIIAVADAVREETISLFRVPADRVVTIPRGVDRSRLRPSQGSEVLRDELGIEPGAPVVLSLGALTWEKDPMAHLDTMRRVRRHAADAVHLIAGDGPLRGDLERRVAAGPEPELTRILGARNDVAELLAITDVLLLASRSEGMPGCLIEAGMAGVPAAAYAVAGVPEVVVDGVTGFTVARRDAGALAERVIELLRDAPLRARLGAQARSRCVDRFEISVVAPAYLSVYEEVAA